MAKKCFVDDQLKEIISSSDVSLCNFEAAINNSVTKPIHKAGPYVAQAKESIKYLKYTGFNLVSLANNHIFDYGRSALANTITELNESKIDYVGAGLSFDEVYSTKIIERNGIRVGFLAAAENEFGCLYENESRGGYAWLFHHLIEDNIRALKKEADVIVLMAHAGVEDIAFPIKEWRDRYKRLCDVGVDVIIGHHPHVPQGYEEYNESMIFYSLGNFYFDTPAFINKPDESYSVTLEFVKSGLKNFEIIYHKKVSGKTCRVGKDEVSFSIKKLNSMLGDGFDERNDAVCLELFNEYYLSYYEKSLCALPKNPSLLQILVFIKNMTYKRERKERERNLLLLHNIRIDSHRFVVQRALKLLSE
jgi:poly-gamma-glutamate capsule biosynthesis protein CapA/YwtB (metallophosphatase superfamily)